MGDFGSSIIRTVVPIVVGWVIAVGLKAGLHLDANAVTSVIYPLVAGVYYTVVRFLETRRSSFGWLLGLAKPPVYLDDV